MSVFDVEDDRASFLKPPVYEGHNYAITLRGTDPTSPTAKGFSITASLPEQFGFGVQANYEPRLPNSILEISGGFSNRFLSLIGRGISASQQFIKINRVLQEFSHQTWQSTSPLQLSFPLLFDARYNARSEVLDNIRTLMKVCLPFKKDPDDPLLTPPGPTLGNPHDGRISIRIGNFIYIHSVLLTDVSANFESRFTEDGIPIAASCDITIMTVNTPHRGDIDSFFLSSRDGRVNDQYGIPQDIGNVLNHYYDKVGKEAIGADESDLNADLVDPSEGDEPFAGDE